MSGELERLRALSDVRVILDKHIVRLGEYHRSTHIQTFAREAIAIIDAELARDSAGACEACARGDRSAHGEHEPAREPAGAAGEPRCEHGSWQGTYCPHCGGNRAVFGAQRGLPSLREPAGAELDVELLARAMVWRRYGVRAEEANPADVDDAAVVAAEYARLAARQP